MSEDTKRFLMVSGLTIVFLVCALIMLSADDDCTQKHGTLVETMWGTYKCVETVPR